jgi:hypothetical protein
VRVRVDVGFLAEIDRFDLRFTCADCSYHVRELDTCAHAWPDELHKRLPEIAPGERADVVFCKEFELT